MQDWSASFHPLLWSWFQERFGQPTPVQAAAWPQIRQGEHTLITAPTGGGKTLAAFLVVIDQLLRQALEGTVPEGIQVLYISPLRALSNDVKKNLEGPFAEIMSRAAKAGLRSDSLRIALRTGDTSAAARAQILKRPPQILVTTPESLFLMLSSSKARQTLRTVHTVIIDEIHALARDKRGSHLSLSLEHLSHLCPVDPLRIGLSATQRPLERMAAFLGGPSRQAKIVEINAQREATLSLLSPDLPLGAICSHDQWNDIYQKLADLIQENRSSLIFVNTRRLAEKVCFQLSEILGEEAVACHHGSMSKEKRLEAEDRLKGGQIKAIVATASLELGIDIGTIDLVCQIGSPRSIAAFVQRVGRSGHSLGATPKAILIALTIDEATECLALLRAYREGTMDTIEIPEQPIDIVAQHIVSLICSEEMSPQQVLSICRRSFPYQSLSQETLEKILHWLSEGLGDRTRRGAYLHWDKVNQLLRPRRSARLAVVSSGGAIPEQNLYRVIDEADQSLVGTVDEEFAIESARGDIFLLGNHSWQITGLKGDMLLVQDKQGAPPTVPFWKGEAAGRTFELSQEISRLRAEVSALLNEVCGQEPSDERLQQSKDLLGKRLMDEFCIDKKIADEIAAYLLAQHLALGLIPTQDTIVYERFFDETSGMQLVVHAPFGSRINRAWGLAFRKRFCRGFDFELQATATDNGILLSIGPNQSFPLEAMFRMLHPNNCREILIQALLDVPMFEIRWRWNVTRALAVLRAKAGKRVPPHIQRYQANDLLTAVFPGQTQCFEHRTGDLEIPDHPLVQQTLQDCLQEAMDAVRFHEIMQKIEAQSITLIAKDTREPSPFCYELIHANPYAFLDDAPLEERRVRALSTRRQFDPQIFQELTSLAPEAVSQVKSEAWPLIRDQDELYDALKQAVIMEETALFPYLDLLQQLLAQERAHRFVCTSQVYYVSHEYLDSAKVLYPSAFAHEQVSSDWEAEQKALSSLLRGHLEIEGPLYGSELAERFQKPDAIVQACLQELESQGLILSGHFLRPEGEGLERAWCDRRLLQRIHQLTIEGLREQIKPVPVPSYIHFLCIHQKLHPHHRAKGIEGFQAITEQLAGWEAPSSNWESELYLSRMQDWTSQMTDQLCMTGRLMWGRMRPPQRKPESAKAQKLFGRHTKLSFTPRTSFAWVLPEQREVDSEGLTPLALEIHKVLTEKGALFFDEIQNFLKQSRYACEDALSELISWGLVHSDNFAGLRQLIRPDRKPRPNLGSGAPKALRYETDFGSAGRFALFAAHQTHSEPIQRREAWAWQLLRRYGVVFRELLQREELSPSWSELLPIFRTLEARGLIRGGRFVEKVGGEQYALKESVSELRKVHKEMAQDGSSFIVLSASDPANLMGWIDGTAKIPQVSSNRVLLWKGRYVAWKNRDEIVFSEASLSMELKASMERALRLHGLYRRQDPFCQAPPISASPASTSPSPQGLRSLRKHWQDYLQQTRPGMS